MSIEPTLLRELGSGVLLLGVVGLLAFHNHQSCSNQKWKPPVLPHLPKCKVKLAFCSSSDENCETKKGRVGSNHQGAANGWAGHTNEARAHGQPSKTNATQRQGPGHPGAETRESQRQQGRRQEEKKKQTRHEAAATKTARHKRGGGGGAAKRQAGSTKQARAHGEPRSGRQKKRTTKHSAKAQGTRGWRPEKAGDNGGAHNKRKKNPTAHRQGTGHPGPETRESRRQRGRTQQETKKNTQGTERRQRKPQDT